MNREKERRIELAVGIAMLLVSSITLVAKLGWDPVNDDGVPIIRGSKPWISFVTIVMMIMGIFATCSAISKNDQK